MFKKVIKIRQNVAVVIILAAVAGFASCEKVSFNPPLLNPADTVHFKTDIIPIFTANCIGCHNGGLSPDLRANNAYTSLKNGGFVNLPDSTSVLYIQITSKVSHIPKTTDLQKLQIRYWIRQGAKNN
jgi:hypothetical protein